MLIELFSVFLIGLLSSFSHCYGMCGGFILAYSVKLPKSDVSQLQQVKPHLAYNIGRIVTYTILGVSFGVIGSILKTWISDIQNTLFIVSGIVMLGIGGELLNIVSFTKVFNHSRLFNKYSHSIKSFIKNPTSKNIFYYGMILGFIPCGLVYIAIAKSIAMSNVFQSGLIMLSFGLGTLPALFLFGLGVNFISVRFRNIVIKITAFVVILFGCFTVYKGINKIIFSSPSEDVLHEKCCTEENE